MRSASHEGRLSMIEADRLRKLEDSRQQRQLDLLRVLHILFPPLSRWLPLDRSSSNLRSSSSYSNLDAGSIMPHTPGMGSARERTPKSVRRGVVTPAAIDSVKRMLAPRACLARSEMDAYRGSEEAPRLFVADGPIPLDEEDAMDCLLTSSMRSAVASHMPPMYGIRDWVLRYSTEQHGCSLHTMYRMMEGAGPTVLLVLDAQGARFGGFATGAWAPGARYFGSGESFLFKVHQTGGGGGGSSSSSPEGGGPSSSSAASSSSSSSAAASSNMSFYGWTGSNSHFQLAYHDSIAMGGGGHFGLWLDEAFEYGSSGRCETYDNQPLASEGAESFRVIRVEVWEPQAAWTPRGGGPTSPVSPGSDDAMVSPPIVEQARRQGSSAFLVNLLSPARAYRRD